MRERAAHHPVRQRGLIWPKIHSLEGRKIQLDSKILHNWVDDDDDDRGLCRTHDNLARAVWRARTTQEIKQRTFCVAAQVFNYALRYTALL